MDGVVSGQCNSTLVTNRFLPLSTDIKRIVQHFQNILFDVKGYYCRCSGTLCKAIVTVRLHIFALGFYLHFDTIDQ